LGWDDEDTALHLDDAHLKLTTNLHWPGDTASVDAWRKQWTAAFALKHREVITTSKALAYRLADLARDIRKRCNAAIRIESDTGPLRALMKSFQQALIHDLTDDDFADMYAQTISYGLLSGAVSRPAGVIAENLVDMVPPQTSPFLREMMQTFLNVGGRKWNDKKGKLTGIDFDELGVNDVVDTLRAANMEAVLRDFGNRNPTEDPVIHFYELFLKEYDAEKRMQRGVFYTPRPVVSYIVRSVHELLQTEFGLADGLADTTTWGQMLRKHTDLKLPTIKVKKENSPDLIDQPIDPATPFVQILDPATGTATFLVEVIDVIYRTMKAKWEKEGHGELFIDRMWNDYVPTHLLPRLHGYELMMAPYAIAHMKIGLKLFETGYKFGSGERARIYLTNALEPPQDFSDTFEEMAPALAHEAKAVTDVKRHQRFTVIIGNPPYAVGSSNWSEWIRTEIDDYKRGLDERRINLDDDFIKFFRLSQSTVERTGTGILGLITNFTYLDGRTHRRMRESLLQSFSIIRLVNLQGDQKRQTGELEAAGDENVFDIRQGTSIFVGVKCNGRNAVDYVALSGSRQAKYETLVGSPAAFPGSTRLIPCSPFFYLIPSNQELDAEYGTFPALTDLFRFRGPCVSAERDHVCIQWTTEDMGRVVRAFLTDKEQDLRLKFELPYDSRDWTVAGAQADIRANSRATGVIKPILYRPFDQRFTFFSGKARGFIGTPSWPASRLMIQLKNLAIVCPRQQSVLGFRHVWVSDSLTDYCLISNRTRERASIFPLLAGTDEASMFGKSTGVKNVMTDAFPMSGLSQDADRNLSEFYYIYAILHSPTYRSRYEPLLAKDFPRIPLPESSVVLGELARAGSELVSFHLTKSSLMKDRITTYTGPAEPEVEKLTYVGDTVWLDKKQTCGFAGVPEAVWNFHIGSYQVCEKWLKDRKGRTLSKDDITHYQKIIVALNETIRLMKEIDEVIEKHGGWPGAFVTTPRESQPETTPPLP